jgi:hypothetical protein
MTECLYCHEKYSSIKYDVCPNCAVNTNTKGITVVIMKEDQE